MNMPRFTAEASLYTGGKHYQTGTYIFNNLEIIPQKIRVIRGTGTRDGVRKWCQGGGTLLEGPDHTWCGKGNQGALCDDKNNCWVTP